MAKAYLSADVSVFEAWLITCIWVAVVNCTPDSNVRCISCHNYLLCIIKRYKNQGFVNTLDGFSALFRPALLYRRSVV